MDRNSVSWTGPMPALTTPFHDDGRLDLSGLARNIERQLAAGATGFVVAGCTGEFWSLDADERRAVIALARETMGDRGTLIAGAGAIRADHVIEQIRVAADAGADAALVMPPYFIHATDAEIEAHYATVDRESALPIMLYNIPGNAGNAISPALADRLADLEKVVAIKESSSDWLNFHRTLIAVKDRIRVFCGPSSVFGVAAVQAGADGLIDCFPNVWLGCLDLWYAPREGRVEEAAKLQAIGLAMTDLFVGEGRTLYPATKAAMDHLGVPGGGRPRSPLQPLTGAALRHFLEQFDRLPIDPSGAGVSLRQSAG